jgi:hypothetical protein
MANCGICNKTVNRNGNRKEKIMCDTCKHFYHPHCVKLNSADLDFLSDRQWQCPSCLDAARVNRAKSDTPVKCSVDNSTHAACLSLETVKELLQGLEDRLNKSFEFALGDVTRLSKLVEEQLSTLKVQQECFQQLKCENEHLKKEVSELKLQMVNLDQYSRRNTVEIFGVPEEAGERLIERVKDVGRALAVEVQEADIDVCHRLKRTGGSPAGIIVKFVRRHLAEKLVESRRGRPEFSTRHMGMTMDSRVFVARSLAPARRVLFARARNALKEGRLKYVWVDFAGRVKVRKTHGGEARVIEGENDLRSFLND